MLVGGAGDPFTISEQTIYGVTENEVIITFTDTESKDQYITNITYDFFDGEKTNRIVITDFEMLQEHSIDVYGWADVSQGKYTTNSSYCVDANATQYCYLEYRDDANETMDCDSVLEDKTCLKNQYGVTGQTTVEGYLDLPTTKEKITHAGLKIEQKVEGSIPLAKDGESKIKFKMEHDIFFGNYFVSNQENKYNITACSQYGCVVLDPEWWDANYLKKRDVVITNNDTYSTDCTAGCWVEMSFNARTEIDAGDMLSNLYDLAMVDEGNNPIPFWINRPPTAISPNITIGFNVTNSSASFTTLTYSMYYNYASASQPAFYTLGHFMQKGDDFDMGSDEGAVNSTIWDGGLASNLEADEFHSGTVAGNLSYFAESLSGASAMTFPVVDALRIRFDLYSDVGGSSGYLMINARSADSAGETPLAWGSTWCGSVDDLCVENDVGLTDIGIKIYPKAWMTIDYVMNCNSDTVNITIYNDTSTFFYTTNMKATCDNDLYRIGYWGGYGAGDWNFDNVRIIENFGVWDMPYALIGAEEEPPYITTTFQYSSITFGSLEHNTNNNTPTPDNTVGTYNVTIDTNTNFKIEANGTDPTGNGQDFYVGNLTIDSDTSAGNLAVGNGISLTSSPQVVDTDIPSATTVHYNGAWFSIPYGTYATTYTSTVTLTYSSV